jgi:NAD(P)-dependent dehydrogenase (short-subunit alcohol dehydrogenase family)
VSQPDITDYSRGAVAVIGAAGSVGTATAASLAAEGYGILLIDSSPLADSANELAGLGHGRVATLEVDVSDEDSVSAAAEEIRRSHGSLSAVVHIAGVLQKAAAIVDLAAAEWDRVLQINLTGPFLVAKHFSPLLEDNTGAAFVSVGSMWGYEGHAMFSAYCVSKAGLRVFSQALAAELAPRGIRVNVVAPGNIDGPMHHRALAAEAELLGVPESEVRACEWAKIPFGKPARPRDIADAIAFLIGPKSLYITGSVVDVNGGTVFR